MHIQPSGSGSRCWCVLRKVFWCPDALWCVVCGIECRTIHDDRQGPPLSIGSTSIDACVVAQRFRDRNPR